MWEDMPELTDEHERLTNLRFSPYIFYSNRDRDTRTGHCTACNADITVYRIQRIMTAEDTAFLDAKHNDMGTCPVCKEQITYKSVGKSKNRGNLHATGRIIIILPVNENKVYARCFFVYKDYYNYSKHYTDCMLWGETVRYIWEPGKFEAYKYDWDQTGLGVNPNGRKPQQTFNRKSTAIEPFSSGDVMRGGFNTYDIINESELSKTFLRYAQHELFTKGNNLYSFENKIFKYLSLYCVYPQFEMLAKLGHMDVINDMVYENRNNGRYFNWKAQDPAKFFKMTKQEYKSFRAAGGELELAKAYTALKKFSPNSTDYNTVQKYLDAFKSQYNYFITFVSKYKMRHIHLYNYLQKHVTEKRDIYNTLIMYKDYIEAAEKLQYDFKSEIVLMPRALIKAHDTATTTLALVAEELRQKAKASEYAAQEKKLSELYKSRAKQYVFSADGYCIIQPESMSDIVKEGARQNHCVAGYAPRHAEGKLTILFMRTADEPDASLYTIEMQGKQMHQVQGYHNESKPKGAEKDFFEKWQTWVKVGSPRDKQGNPVISEEERARILAAS